MNWLSDAACRSHPTSLFFPPPTTTGEDNPASVAVAKAVCRYCPVKPDCLAFAFETKDYEAILGGTTGRERRRMVRRGRREA